MKVGNPATVPVPLTASVYDTPLGSMVAVTSDVGLRSVGWDLEGLGDAVQAPHPHLEAFASWLRAYIGKKWDQLPVVPLDLQGSPADLAVWNELLTIGPGRSRTYGELAAALGKPPGAARAIGAAVGRNPVAMVVPCHRVIGANGSLTGYAGGVTRKAWLLKHEGLLLL